MPAVVPLVGVAAGVYSASRQSRAARDSARASSDATQASIDEQRRQYDLTRSDQRPFLDAGYDALGRQQRIIDGDYSQFQNSPDYTYAYDEMQRGIERGAASRGGLYNGGTSVDLAKHLGGLANQNLNSYWNKLAGRAGQGQVTASGLGALGAGMANNISSLNMTNAANQASSYQQRADALSGAAFGAAGLFGNWYNGGGWGKSLGGTDPYKQLTPYKG
jgi:hypothetical protein